MNRVTPLMMAMVAVICCGQAWLGTVAPAQAAPVTDTFELKVTNKEFCEGNPKFFEINKINATDDVLLTITRDVNGDGDYTDVSATIGLVGSEPDVIPMKRDGLCPRSADASRGKD